MPFNLDAWARALSSTSTKVPLELHKPYPIDKLPALSMSIAGDFEGVSLDQP